MNIPRYLCSDLVTVRFKGVEWVANLEEIWINGGVLECETAFEAGAQIEIRAGAAVLSAIVARVEKHEFGWRVEVEFSASTPWRAEEFNPKHLLDLSSLKTE
jgi:hypothetical protein